MVQTIYADHSDIPGPRWTPLLLDARTRLVSVAGFALVVVGLSDLLVLLLALLMALLLVIWCAQPVGALLRRLLALDWFVLMMLILLPFTMPGEAAFSLFGWQGSWQGLAKAAEIGLTVNAVALVIFVLVATIEPVTIGHALHRLGVPVMLAQLLLFTIRYIDMLREEYECLRLAMRARGFALGTNIHCYRSFGYLLGMMLVRAAARSQRVLEAMKCRGFSGAFHMVDQLQFTRADVIFALGMLLGLSGLVGLEMMLAA